MPKTYTVPPPPHHNEGKTVAGWTMNLGIVAGSTLIGVGLVLSGLTILIWVGSVVILAAVVVGIGLSMAGLGQPRGHADTPTRKAAHRVTVAESPGAQPAEADAR